jgi:hypothetical protein
LCAIFADSTWIGDSKDVDALFARREVHYRALSEIVTELREVRQSSSGTSALNEALRRLNKPNQDEAVSALKERMRGNVQAALRASDKPGRSSDELLTQWILQNQARLEATEVHRHKGPQAVLK